MLGEVGRCLPPKAPIWRQSQAGAGLGRRWRGERLGVGNGYLGNKGEGPHMKKRVLWKESLEAPLTTVSACSVPMGGQWSGQHLELNQSQVL